MLGAMLTVRRRCTACFFVFFFSVQTTVSWYTLFIIWYSRQPLGIKVQSGPVLR